MNIEAIGTSVKREKWESFPPSSSAYPLSFVRKMRKSFSHIEKLADNPTPPWLENYSREQIESKKEIVNKLLRNYFRSLDAFREVGDSYMDARKNAIEIYNDAKDFTNALDTTLPKNEHIARLVRNERFTVTVATLHYFPGENKKARDYYVKPELFKELPGNTDKVFTAGHRFLAWESLTPFYEPLQNYPNPFKHEVDLYAIGVSDLNFGTDDKGNDCLQVSFNQEQQEPSSNTCIFEIGLSDIKRKFKRSIPLIQ